MSIKVKEIPFIAYPTSDPDRTKDFYQRIIGIKCTLDHPVSEDGKQRWLEFDVGNCAIAVTNIIPIGAVNGVGAALEVEDLDAALELLQKENVTIKTEVMSSPSCRFFIIGDPDGNDLTIHQHN